MLRWEPGVEGAELSTDCSPSSVCVFGSCHQLQRLVTLHMKSYFAQSLFLNPPSPAPDPKLHPQAMAFSHRPPCQQYLQPSSSSRGLLQRQCQLRRPRWFPPGACRPGLFQLPPPRAWRPTSRRKSGEGRGETGGWSVGGWMALFRLMGFTVLVFFFFCWRRKLLQVRRGTGRV